MIWRDPKIGSLVNALKHRDAERDFVQMQTQDEHGDHSRTRDQPAGKTKEDGLPSASTPVRQTLKDVFGMGAGMGINMRVV